MHELPLRRGIAKPTPPRPKQPLRRYVVRHHRGQSAPKSPSPTRFRDVLEGFVVEVASLCPRDFDVAVKGFAAMVRRGDSVEELDGVEVASAAMSGSGGSYR